MSIESFPIDGYTDPELIHWLCRYTFKEDSLMQYQLIELFDERWKMFPYAARDGVATLLYNDDNKFVGWSLTFKDGPASAKGTKDQFYVWILTRHRRKGYGKELMREAQERLKTKFQVHPHDRVSSAFFLKYNNGAK